MNPIHGVKALSDDYRILTRLSLCRAGRSTLLVVSLGLRQTRSQRAFHLVLGIGRNSEWDSTLQFIEPKPSSR